MNPVIVTATPKSDYVYDIKLKYEPFYVAYHSDEEVVKLPRSFNQQHINEIGEKTYLADPAGNMFQIAIEKRYSEAYFVDGWTQVGKFYGLQAGGWVRLVFVAHDMFLITLRNRLDHPVNYPLPAKIHRLGEDVVTLEYPRPDPVSSHFLNICKKPDLFHTLDKTLSHSDINSGFLHIPLHFCEVAFRQNGNKIVVFDEYGRNGSCVVEFDKNSPLYSGIGEGWNRFCVDRGYFEGLRVQLAVPCGSPTMLNIIVSHKFI